ncbi:MAG: hypothetical protein ABJA93_02935 [Sporichthyaceae bacterium]
MTRIGEFSPEYVHAEWMDADVGLKVGRRFDGTNRKVTETEQLTWTRPCTVTIVRPGSTFGYLMGDRHDGSPSGAWTYEFCALSPGRCRLQLIFRHHRTPTTTERS